LLPRFGDARLRGQIRVTQLDTDRIAATALAVVDKRGPAGFTIRAVADALRVTPMALYHHVKDKAELARLVVREAIRKHPLATPAGDWREDLWLMAQWTRVALNLPALPAKDGASNSSVKRLRRSCELTIHLQLIVLVSCYIPYT
jgi:AcrR family transcriptional regulator